MWNWTWWPLIFTILGCFLLNILIDKQHKLVTSLTHLQEALSHVHYEQAKTSLVHFHVEKSNRDLRRAMTQQFEYMRDLTMSSRSRFIRLKGLAEEVNETNIVLEERLIELFQYLGEDLIKGDIERVNRIGKKKDGFNRVVMAELHSHATKQRLLRRAVKLRNTQYAIQDDLTNVKLHNVIEPPHDHEDHPHECGLLNFVSAPEDFGKSLKHYGAWFGDPLSDEETVWTMPNFYKTKEFQEYASLSDLIAHRSSRAYKLKYPWAGTGHIAYNNSIYFNKFNSSTMVKYDLKTDDYLEADLPDALFANFGPYQVSAYTDFDFAADEEGLWVIHSTHQNTLDIVVTKLTHDLHIVQSFRTNWRKQWSGNAFMACGVLYVLKKYDQKNTIINFAYDTHSKQYRHLQIPFEIRYGAMTSLSYNHKEKRLYGWDNQHLVAYDLEFFSSTAVDTWMHLNQPGALDL